MNEERSIPQSAAPTAPFRQGGQEIERTPEMIGAEIRMYVEAGRRITLLCGIEIGRRLAEAKEMLNHGEWLPWLERETEFSSSSAQRYMKIFDEYGAAQLGLFGPETNSPTLGNLSISNALRLLAIPEEERESFAEEHDVEHLSAREVEALVKERTAEIEVQKEAAEKQVNGERDARWKAEKAREEADTAREVAENARREAEEAVGKLRRELKELEERPAAVVMERDEVAIEEAVRKARAEAAKDLERDVLTAKKEAKAEAEKKIAELREQLSSAASGKTLAEKELEKLREQLREAEKAGTDGEQLRARVKTLEKQLVLADPEVSKFSAAFDRAQDELGHMNDALHKVKSEEIREKLRKAVLAMLDGFMGRAKE